MLITKECDYALRMIRELNDGTQKKMQEICETEAIPTQFAYKILKKLEKGGAVKIIRGVKGGCQISPDIERFSMFDLLKIMGDKQLVNQCIADEYDFTLESRKEKSGTVHRHLLKMQESLDCLLKEQRLVDLLQ